MEEVKRRSRAVILQEIVGRIRAAARFIGIEAIERGMKIGKERRVLRIDLVGIHGHDRDVVMFPFDLPRHVNTPLGFREPLVTA